MTQDEISIYCDGGTDSLYEGVGGIGIYMTFKEHKKMTKAKIGTVSHNQADLASVWCAFGLLKEWAVDKEIRIHSDSEYVVSVLTNPRWTPSTNIELVNEIKEKASKYKHLVFIKVPVIGGPAEYDIAKALAIEALSSGEMNTVTYLEKLLGR